MNNINERLDKVRELIKKEEFLEGKGLSNEVNIRIFCYNPVDEMIIKRFISQITTDSTLNCRIIECDLYKIFLDACEDIDILDAIPDMEETDGNEFLLEQLHSTVGEDEFITKIQYAPHEESDVLLITGVGDVFPFMRVHSLLEALQPHFSDIPILVMYPGEFTGYTLKLFNKLKPNDYYRAFNII
ncbi:MAG: DUF1788 domain-containing protein [Eubacteriales bacterium]